MPMEPGPASAACRNYEAVWKYDAGGHGRRRHQTRLHSLGQSAAEREIDDGEA